MRRAIRKIHSFIALETVAGFLLFACALLAFILENTQFSDAYQTGIHFPLGLTLGGEHYAMPFHLWVNDGLMVLFFLLVGIEIKQEWLEGHLRHRSQAILPLAAALGGVLVPAFIYFWVTRNTPDYRQGWAVPTATDIAFSLAILRMFGARVPVALKVFLTAVAVIDDLIAILIIGIFYNHGMDWAALGVAACCVAVLAWLNLRKVQRLLPYCVVGLFLWVAVLQSGIHATLAGVILGLLLPLRGGNTAHAPAKRLEQALHPWIAFLILPLFALCNSGLSLAGLSISSLKDPLPLGIFLALFLGKQLGVFSSSWAIIRLKIGELPEGCNWCILYGTTALTGVGFTMSLFIGNLAFDSVEMNNLVRLGVITGSLVSALAGGVILYFTLPKPPPCSAN